MKILKEISDKVFPEECQTENSIVAKSKELKTLAFLDFLKPYLPWASIVAGLLLVLFFSLKATSPLFDSLEKYMTKKHKSQTIESINKIKESTTTKQESGE